MSRHRIVRNMNYDDYVYDDVYGHSVDDDSCISPTDAQQWIYDRERGQQSMSAFIRNNRDIEEDETEEAEAAAFEKARRDSENFQMPILNDIDQAKLTSCIDEVRSVVGDSISDSRIVETSMRFNYDITKILDEILNDEIEHKSEDNTPISTAAKIVTPKLDIKQSAPKLKITAAPIEREARRGLDTNTSNVQSSPAVSGRNTPESPEDSIKSNTAPIFKVSKEQAQRDAQKVYVQERADQKAHFHMIVIGHVDAGKSTLMGHLLFDTGNVSQRIMHKHEQESKKIGKQSFMYAWVLDETGEERSRGITMDVGHSRIETDTKIVTLLDAPGHKDFIPNMISGATQADVALLVVDATRGEFESGFEHGGQTREHALLVRSLGVNQLGVVINKLDTVNWSQERFNEIVMKLKTFLKQAGFRDSDVSYTPCSGLTGENLAKPATVPELKKWYNGTHLLNIIDNFKIPPRPIERPFRMSVSDIFKGTGSGLSISGRIETGVLGANDKVLVGANREQAQVKALLIDEMPQANVFAGDQVSVVLSGIDVNHIATGTIIYDPQNPIQVTSRFQARILVFNLKVPITIGYPVLLHHQTLIEPAIVSKLTAQIHKGTGEVVKKKPRCIGNNTCALVELETTRPICMELYADYKELGRIMLRVNGVTIAAGMVTKIR